MDLMIHPIRPASRPNDCSQHLVSEQKSFCESALQSSPPVCSQLAFFLQFPAPPFFFFFGFFFFFVWCVGGGGENTQDPVGGGGAPRGGSWYAVPSRITPEKKRCRRKL